MIRLSRVAPLAILVAATIAAACRPQEPPPPPEPVVNEDSIRREQARRDSIARAEQARRDAIARAEQARRDSIARAESARTQLRNAIAAPVYFDFDRSEIRADQRTTLDAKIPILQANPNLRIRIAGHTDERGSDEYNMALGQRRAASARRYLEQRGIAANRIQTVSFGEERPVATGSSEAAWAQNRRAEFEITAGGDNIQAPMDGAGDGR